MSSEAFVGGPCEEERYDYLCIREIRETEPKNATNPKNPKIQEIETLKLSKKP